MQQNMGSIVEVRSVQWKFHYETYLIRADKISIYSDGSAHCDGINNHGNSEDYICNDQTSNDHSERVIQYIRTFTFLD